MSLEFDRVGAADTDVYCLALKQSAISGQRPGVLRSENPTEKNPQLGELNAEAQPNRGRYKREN